MNKEQLLSTEDTSTLENKNQKLVIYNDDVNTFDWVIESIIDVLNYDLIRAEQITILVHSKGKAIAKSAAFDVLKPLKEGLVDKGLSVTIED